MLNLKKWVLDVYSSSYKLGHRRGVAILISSGLNYEHIAETKDVSGRYVKVTGRIEGNEITLLNVYAPPRSEWLFYRQIFDLMVNSQGVVICGGDFNIRLNSLLDSSGTSTHCIPLIRKVKSQMKELGIIDVWRELYPTSREYTHYSSPHSSYSRIDYFFMFSIDRFKIKECDIATIDLSDHSLISMTLKWERKIRKTLWRLNSNILNNPNIVQRLKGDIKEFINLNDNGEVSPGILWDTLKAVMRGKIISITSYIKRLKMQKLEDLQRRLKQL
ncbi:hypothetical protein LDENG_00264990 [Lucifuga dentata]|nr:hypothetical protein LDENG_00264990 [Lucifuga dentata]